MTLLLREVGRFLAGTAAWIGFEAAIATAVASLVGAGAALDRKRTIGVSFLGAIALAAAAVRVSAPVAWAPIIGGRPLPVVWSGLGAAMAVAVVRVRRARATTAP